MRFKRDGEYCLQPLKQMSATAQMETVVSLETVKAISMVFGVLMVVAVQGSKAFWGKYLDFLKP